MVIAVRDDHLLTHSDNISVFGFQNSRYFTNCAKRKNCHLWLIDNWRSRKTLSKYSFCYNHLLRKVDREDTLYTNLGRLLDYDEDDMRYHPYMNGQLVFKNAVVRFSEVIQEALQKNGKNTTDIDLFVPHQANLRIAQFVQKKFSLRDDQVYNNIMRYGNTTAASIPIALSEAWEAGKIKQDDTVLLAAFGSGFTWGSALIHW